MFLRQFGIFADNKESRWEFEFVKQVEKSGQRFGVNGIVGKGIFDRLSIALANSPKTIKVNVNECERRAVGRARREVLCVSAGIVMHSHIIEKGFATGFTRLVGYLELVKPFIVFTPLGLNFFDFGERGTLF